MEYNRTKVNKAREEHGRLKVQSIAKDFIVAIGESLRKIVSKEELS